MATGLLLVLIGVFLVLRTVVKDGQGRNLVDRILGMNEATA